MKHTAELPPFAEADGVFFLTLSSDRASLAYAVERLIDMLDAMEPDPDLEPWLGSGDDLEDECEDEGAQCEGEGDWNELELDSSDEEPDLGWTEHFNQHAAMLTRADAWACEDGEPELGWCGHGTGWRGEGTDDREGDEGDYSPSPECIGGSWDGDGSGHAIGEEMIGELMLAKHPRRTASSDVVR